MRLRAAALGLPVAWAALASAESTPRPERSYYVYVCAESEDAVAKLRFGPGGLEVLKTITVGSFPAETEGPHGISVSPDEKHWFLSLAHGMPFGSIHKYDAETDEWLGDVTVGMFPATMAVSPATGLLYVVNFDLHGDMEPSSISVVETGTMIEVERMETGIMPHGARLNREGTKLYSVNMMGDNLVEVDALEFSVARTLALSEPGADASTDPHGTQGGNGNASFARMAHEVKPTWATAPTAEGKLYVAGNGNNVIYEVALEPWRISRRLDAGAGMGPYNLDVTSDGKLLVATYKSGARVGIWDLVGGVELARIETTRTVPHGVAIADDDRYAFVTLEGVGGEPGTVEVYDLASRARVAKADVGKQAGGIVFWKGVP
jgi:DNA-binding beta-propeller fold protein YncE